MSIIISSLVIEFFKLHRYFCNVSFNAISRLKWFNFHISTSIAMILIKKWNTFKNIIELLVSLFWRFFYYHKEIMKKKIVLIIKMKAEENFCFLGETFLLRVSFLCCCFLLASFLCIKHLFVCSFKFLSVNIMLVYSRLLAIIQGLRIKHESVIVEHSLQLFLILFLKLLQGEISFYNTKVYKNGNCSSFLLLV